MNDRITGIAFVAAAVLVEALGQIAFKFATKDADGVVAALRNRTPMAMGIGCFIIEGFLWTLALKYLDLTIAQPLAGSELIIVAILSRIFLRERINFTRWIGIVLICAGVILVGMN